MSGQSQDINNTYDREERKRLRKKRIEKSASHDHNNDDESEHKNEANIKTGYQQTVDSLFHLDKRKHKGLEEVTSVRVKTNDEESKRRIEDDELRRGRLTKLQQEALASAKANAAIEMKWAELLEKDIPQELHQEIQLQLDSCSGIIQSKDELIASFQTQLRGKDEEYVRTVRKQGEDIDQLLARIRQEFKELQSEYEKEFDGIDEAYLEERERTITDYTAEIDAIFEHRRNKEVEYKETKERNEENYQQEIDELITNGADQYNKLKIELEMNIQALKQQLEEIRATYQLNTEKLDYNYRVLTELDVEKNAELTRYKRRLNKLKGQLNVLVGRFTEMEASDSKTNNELTENYRSLTLKYKDLQAKFRHFEIADTTKYGEVWTMHEEEVKDLVDQLLKADKIITEQQFGWKWRAPDIQALQQVLGKQGGMGLNADSAANQDHEKEVENVPEYVDPEVAIAQAQSKKVAGAKVKAVLRMLAKEAEFMINPEVTKSIEALADNADGELMQAETLLRSLGIKSEDRLNQLITYFFKEKTGSESKKEKQGSTPEQEEYDNELALLIGPSAPDIALELRDMIKPEDVIAAVKTYIEDVNVESGPVGGATVGGGSKANQEELRIAQKRLTSMRNYWLTLSNIVSDETVEVWKQLESDCQNLRDMLNRRSKSIEEVDNLNLQNTELKKLLNQYLGDTLTNASFKVPPSQVMKVREVTVGNTKGMKSMKKSFK